MNPWKRRYSRMARIKWFVRVLRKEQLMINTWQKFFTCAITAVTIAMGSVTFAGEKPPLKIFNGEKRLLIVHGYSTSAHWWAFLQRRIDRSSGEHDLA